MKREDCKFEKRPCYRFTCRHNISTDRYPLDILEARVDAGILRASDFVYGTNCVLDIVDRNPNGLSNISIADILDISKETVRLTGLGALTKTRAFMRGEIQLQSEDEFEYDSMYEFIRNNFSMQREDIEVCLDKYPKLTYDQLIMYAKDSGVFSDLEITDQESFMLSNILTDATDEFMDTYNLTTIPRSYEKNTLGAILGFSGEMIDVWIANGLDFHVSVANETRIERASLLAFFDEFGQYYYKVMYNPNRERRVNKRMVHELRLDLITEINEETKQSRSRANRTGDEDSLDEDSLYTM